jgi:iron complex transport system substrate-binding protein
MEATLAVPALSVAVPVRKRCCCAPEGDKPEYVCARLDLRHQDRTPTPAALRSLTAVRIVSLLPGATEIVCALGAGEALVGVSHECDHPPFVRGLPAVTRPKLDVHRVSVAIDADVRRLVAEGLGVYEIDVARLAALRPDVIVTQHQCEVCAVSYAEVEAAARATLGTDVRIVSLAPRTLTDVWDDVARVAAALDRVYAGNALVAALTERLASLARITEGLPWPTVACVEWLDPLMLAAHWTSELVRLAGGSYPFADVGARSGVVDWEVLTARQPDVVVLMPCGFPIAQTMRELDWLRQRPEWRGLHAVRTGRASVVDGNAYFNRPGPRLVESAEILAALLHPDECGDRMVAGAALLLAS